MALYATYVWASPRYRPREDRVEVLMTSVRVSIEAAVAENVDGVTRLHQRADETASATERFHQRLEQLQVPPDLLAQKLAPLVEAVLTRVQHIILGEALDALIRAEKVGDAIKEMYDPNCRRGISLQSVLRKASAMITNRKR